MTHFDKLQSDRDRRRVLNRLNVEADGAFSAILPLATLQAISAGLDETAWTNSGGAALIEHLVTTLVAAPEGASAAPARDRSSPVPPAAPQLVASTPQPPENHVVPRRVRPKSANPARPAAADILPTQPLPPIAGQDG